MVFGTAGKLPIRLIALVLMVLLVAGVGVFALNGKGHKKSAAHQEKKPTATMALGEFVVNLADTGEIRYLKTDVVLAIAGEAGGGGHGESAPDPAVRDAVIGVLSSKRFRELAQPGGKEQLKKDIIKAVSGRIEKAEVLDVYFNDFAMQ